MKWKDFELRQLFNTKYRQWNPKYKDTKHMIRFTPSSPLFQRKKEAPLRAMMNAITQHEDYKDWDLTPLWHCLVLMAPQPKRKHDTKLPAWAKIEFVNTEGGKIECHIHLTEECRDVLCSDSASPGQTLFAKAYTDQMFGRQREEDVAERTAADEASEQGATSVSNTKTTKTGI